MTFEFDGKKYEKASTHQTSWGEKMVELLPLKGTERVLDIGCGDGRVTRKIALRVNDGEVLGVDASNGMINAAKKYETQNLHFKVLDILKLDFFEQFDVIFSHAALHWLRDHETLLQNIYNALRQGGYARLNFAGNGTCPKLIRVLKEVMKQASYAKYFTDFLWPWYMPDSVEYQKLLSRSPFKEIEVSEEHKERLFPSPDPLIKWIDQPCLVPFLAEISEKDKKEEFRNTVMDHMLQETWQSDSGYLEKFCRLDVFLKK